MTISWEYFSALVSSTFRMCTPILLCGLASAVCAKAKIFNIAMEGCMLLSAFFGIVANYYSGGNVFLSVCAGVISSVLTSALLAVFIIKLKASPVIAGMAVNTTAGGITVFLMYIFFGTKGLFQDPSLKGLTKITPFFASTFPKMAQLFSGLTWIDYFSWIAAVCIYIFLYKTVAGFHLRAVGINLEAARSLGTDVEKYQFITLTLSGILCGLAGITLSMGSVTLFIQNISSGKGYIALTAAQLGGYHPLGVLAASLFFGVCQAIGNFLQNTSIKTQLSAMIPYIATLIAMILSYIVAKRQSEKKIQRSLQKEKIQ